jgi:hypothetical protein
MKLKRTDLEEAKRALKWLAKQHGLKIHDLMEQADSILEIPSNYIDSSSCLNGDDGDEIVIGWHPNPEVKVLALAHEIGHMLAPFESGVDINPIMLRESNAWLWAIRYFNKRWPRLKFHPASIFRVVDMLSSYQTYMNDSFGEDYRKRDRRFPLMMYPQFAKLLENKGMTKWLKS